jgi:phage baseplate assembly protein V
VAADGSETRAEGVALAIVTNNNDPDHLGRVRVLTSEKVEEWARVAAPMAGPERGTYFLPEVGEEVLVAFDRGDPGRPYVLGGLWSKDTPPPERNEDGENNRRTMRSRSGHTITFDDTEGAARIEIVDAAGNSLVFDSTSGAITITAHGDLTLESKAGTLRIKGTSVEIEGTRVDVDGKALTSVKGAVVTIN